MDVSSIRGLVVLVIQLQTIIIFAQALSDDGERSRTKGNGSSGHGKQRTSCCFNGGLCVLGSFCHCPKNFRGRYCEHRVSERPCHSIPHNSWVKAGCSLCLCVDGYITCLPRAFDGCDDKSEKEVMEHIWDYEDQMVILATSVTTTSKYDAEDADYYDYYDNVDKNKPSSSSRTGASFPVVAICGALCAVCRIAWTFWSRGS